MVEKNNKTDFQCKFCNNKYSTKSNMIMHQKTAKKCLIIRDSLIKDLYKCDYCNFSSIRKDTFSLHTKTCKKMKTNKYEILEKETKDLKKKIDQFKIKLDKNVDLLEEKDKTIYRLENEIKELREQLRENFNIIASKPTIVNNTTNTKVNNMIMVDFKESSINDKVENNFTLEHLNDGIRGVAKFTKDHIVNSENGQHKYICSDPSRAMFKYKDENGVVQKDVSATKLKNAIKEPIIKKSKALFINENSRLFDCIANGEDDNEKNILMNDQITFLTDNFRKVKNMDDNHVDYAKEMVLVLADQ